MKKKAELDPTKPLLYDDHPKPRTRRDFLSAGLITGAAMTIAPGLLSMVTSKAFGQAAAPAGCAVNGGVSGMIPFLCFDMAGGANIAGSNVLVGGQGGQMDFISEAGYSKLGLPSDMTPDKAGQVNTELGLAFHADSPILLGIKDKANAATLQNVNGCIICARSANDTGNNPHNPTYGIARAGAEGSVTKLIGTRSSETGGRSAAPGSMVNPEDSPTKVDRPSDARGLVDTGKLVELLSPDDARKVLKAMESISSSKLARMTEEQKVKELINCGYIQTTALATAATPDDLDPLQDQNVLNIFSANEINGSDRRYRKTASVMKLVVDGRAGAGTIEEGGYDYHNSTRATGEVRDFRMGQQIGGALQYAASQGKPLMLYVFSDGSVASNGTLDNSPEGKGKGIWRGDNSSTASVFILVYNPGGRPTVRTGKQQIGFFRADGSVDVAATPVANNVNSLAHSIVLNFLALHNRQGEFAAMFPDHGLGNDLDALIAFNPIR